MTGNRAMQSTTAGFSNLQRATLEGDLQNLQIANLLQSIGMGKMTGRLEVISVSDTASVYFNEGVPIHCTIRDAEGDNALVELVAWEEGAFRFYQEPKTQTVTVKKRLDFLLMEGAAFDDQQKYLKQRGMRFDSYPIRRHQGISEQEFEKLVAAAPVGDMNLLKALYQSCDNRSTLVEVLRRKPLSKIELVPALYSLVSTELISFVDSVEERGSAPTSSSPQAIKIDWTPVRTFEKNLLRQDTNLLTYPGFLYFLEKEFYRFERFGQPFSILIIEIGMKPSDPRNLPDPLPLRAVREFAQRIEKLKRKTDLLSHFETFHFAMLLPQTYGSSARSFAARVGDVVLSSALSEGLNASSIVMGIGAACVPEDCQDLGMLLSLAKPRRQPVQGS